MKWLILIETFGPIVINVSRVINDIVTIAFTYFIVCLAFSFGLIFILDDYQNPISKNVTHLVNLTNLTNLDDIDNVYLSVQEGNVFHCIVCIARG